MMPKWYRVPADYVLCDMYDLDSGQSHLSYIYHLNFLFWKIFVLTHSQAERVGDTRVGGSSSPQQ